MGGPGLVTCAEKSRSFCGRFATKPNRLMKVFRRLPKAERRHSYPYERIDPVYQTGYSLSKPKIRYSINWVLVDKVDEIAYDGEYLISNI